MNKLIKIIIVIICLPAVVLCPPPASADYYFNPHFIISDEDMTDYSSMGLLEIQRFLEEKGSALAWRTFIDYQGFNKTSSEIILQAALESKINPKVILTTLQKEQSLIEDPIPTQNQFDKAMGYRCPDSGGCNPKALGFGKQVDGAAWQFQQYYLTPDNWTYRINQLYEIDGFLVIPANQATANLYNYTPHYSGNDRFFLIWQKYWGRNYPDGSLMKTKDNPAVWLVQYNLRRLITSWGALISRFDPKTILIVSRTDLEKYEIGPPIKFNNYSLLHLPTGPIYLLTDDELHHIVSQEVFRKIGFSLEEIIDVSESDLAGYKFGSDITTDSIYPTGALLQNKDGQEIYFVQNGIKQIVISPEIMKSRFNDKKIIKVGLNELAGFETGEPVKFRDGDLVSAVNDPKVYVISNGFRRWLKSEKVFAKFGYKWDNMITTSQAAVELHPLGEDIE
jgi:hypothetical protein